jgi:hypothetical protein
MFSILSAKYARNMLIVRETASRVIIGMFIFLSVGFS